MSFTFGSKVLHFDLSSMRTGRPDLLAVRSAADHIELHFGSLEGEAGGAQAAVATHRLRMDRAAARHLEEVLTQLAGQPEPAK